MQFNKIIKNSRQFLKSGGFESITTINFAITAEVLARNQADWFIITGHGNPNTGSVGESDKVSTAFIINPSELIKKDYTSEYDEDMDVLILGTCGVLNTTSNINAWYKVLPKGVILGYRKNIDTQVINGAFDEMNKCNSTQLNTNEKIGLMWRQINQNLYTSTFTNVGSHLSPFNKMLRTARHFAYIVNDTYCYINYDWVKYKPYSMRIKINGLKQHHIPDFKE